MKTTLIVCSLIASALALDTACAKGLESASSDYRAVSANPDLRAPVGPLYRRVPDCGTDRLSPVWGPDNQPAGYECLGNANGS